MQFAVPQFTDIEDKLIGPLTLKQFLSILATGGVVMFFWSILGFGIIFILFALPTVLIGLILTFGKLNGRPLFAYVFPIMNFISRPKVMIYHREGVAAVGLFKKKAEGPKSTDGSSRSTEVSQSRLKKLAYLLDQKTEEEKELIAGDK